MYQDSDWLEFWKYEDQLRKSEKGKTDQGVTGTVKPLLHVQIGLEWLNQRKGVVADGLIDEDALSLFIDYGFIQTHGIKMKKSEIRDVRKVEMHMFFKRHHKKVTMTVCELGKADIILGRGWMRYHHPEIDLRKGEIKFTRCPTWSGEERELARLLLRKMRSQKRQLPNEDVSGPKESTVQQRMPETEDITDEMEIESQINLKAMIMPEINEEDVKRKEDELFERWRKTGERDERIKEQIKTFEEDWLTDEEGIVKVDDEMIKPEFTYKQDQFREEMDKEEAKEAD